MTDKIEEIIETIRSLRAKVILEGKDALSVAFKDFFASTPGVKSVFWDQYTPYFNDGDECVFHVHEMHVELDESLLAEDAQKFLERNNLSGRRDYEQLDALQSITDRRSWYKYDDIERTSLNAQETAIIENFSKLENKLNHSELHEMFKFVFGDHVTVIATPDEIVTEECEHD